MNHLKRNGYTQGIELFLQDERCVLFSMAPIQLLPHPGPGLLQVHTHYGILQSYVNASLRQISWLVYR